MATTKTKSYNYFIGIDISRNKLDYAVLQGKTFLFHREAANQADVILQLISEFKALPKFTMTKTVFCMEYTGIYANHLLMVLKKLKANIVMEDAVHIRNSLGLLRGKYDKIDAIRIASYAHKNRDELRMWVPKRDVVEQLAQLSSLRNRLMNTQLRLTIPLGEQEHFVNKKINQAALDLCFGSINAVRSDVLKVDAAILKMIQSDETLNRIVKLIMSIPGIGIITAVQIIISTNEFLDIKCPKKFACYAGVAPFKTDSGTIKVRAKVSHIANKRVKSLLHICAVRAIRIDRELKAYYDRKTQTEGKPKMAVFNAIRYKLILRVFVCVNQNRPYAKDYKRLQQTILLEA
jgi:transposase